MAVLKPILAEFGIHHRLESCEPELRIKWWMWGITGMAKTFLWLSLEFTMNWMRVVRLHTLHYFLTPRILFMSLFCDWILMPALAAWSSMLSKISFCSSSSLLSPWARPFSRDKPLEISSKFRSRAALTSWVVVGYRGGPLPSSVRPWNGNKHVWSQVWTFFR